LSLGYILKNRETGEYRYFIPYTNNELVKSPHRIKGPKTLQNAVEAIRKLDPLTFVMNNRPNSKFEPIFISNINFNVYNTNFPLGSAPSILPDYINKKKHLMKFLNHRTSGKPIKDNLCLFRCLAHHLNDKVKNLEKLTKRYF
jgi:hypothetical protein